MAIVNQDVGWAFPFRFEEGRVATVGGEPEELPPSSDVDDAIRQGVLQVLLTGKNERVMLGNFGVGADRFLFAPLGRALGGMLATETAEQIRFWNPRVIATRVIPDIRPSEAKLALGVELRRRDRADESLIKVAVALGGG